MSATAGVITYREKTPARSGLWAILALAIVAALLGGLFIGRASAPTPAVHVRTIERFVPVTQPGAFASWIAPPPAGIDNKPGDFEYVKFAQ